MTALGITFILRVLPLFFNFFLTQKSLKKKYKTQDVNAKLIKTSIEIIKDTQYETNQYKQKWVMIIEMSKRWSEYNNKMKIF